MAQREIIWSVKAKKVFQAILEFYTIRNGSNIFSNKLLDNIEKNIELINVNPYLGLKTTISENIRYLIFSNYKIIYKFSDTSIHILMVWDCRQNPDKLIIK